MTTTHDDATTWRDLLTDQLIPPRCHSSKPWSSPTPGLARRRTRQCAADRRPR